VNQRGVCKVKVTSSDHRLNTTCARLIKILRPAYPT